MHARGSRQAASVDQGHTLMQLCYPFDSVRASTLLGCPNPQTVALNKPPAPTLSRVLDAASTGGIGTLPGDNNRRHSNGIPPPCGGLFMPR